jgi:hypothetical protein
MGHVHVLLALDISYNTLTYDNIILSMLTKLLGESYYLMCNKMKPQKEFSHIMITL